MMSCRTGAAYRTSSLTQLAFARVWGLSIKTLSSWLKRVAIARLGVARTACRPAVCHPAAGGDPVGARELPGLRAAARALAYEAGLAAACIDVQRLWAFR